MSTRVGLMVCAVAICSLACSSDEQIIPVETATVRGVAYITSPCGPLDKGGWTVSIGTSAAVTEPNGTYVLVDVLSGPGTFTSRAFASTRLRSPRP